MRPLSIAVTLLVAASCASAQSALRLDEPHEGTVLIPDIGCCCGLWSSPNDGNYEAAIAWAEAGAVSPIGGAFAQRFVFADTVRICAIDLDLTQIGGRENRYCDIYIWDSLGGIPSSVIFMSAVAPGPIATWPVVSTHTFSVDVCVMGEVWAGYWGNWPDAEEGWYIGADIGEDKGIAFTHVAPGLANRPGWQPASLVWDGVASISVGLESNEDSCAVTPTLAHSWGRIKALYARP